MEHRRYRRNRPQHVLLLLLLLLLLLRGRCYQDQIAL